MARNNKRKRRNGGTRITIPLAVVAGLAAPTIKIWEARGSASGMAREAGRILTGFDFWGGTWTPANLKYGLLPLIGGVLVHWLVGSKLGVNRLIAKSGLPVIRI